MASITAFARDSGGGNCGNNCDNGGNNGGGNNGDNNRAYGLLS